MDGEEADKATRPGLVKGWKEHRYQAYEMLEDIEKQRQLAHELLFENEYAYYVKLKGLYDSNEWENVLKTVIEEFEKEPYQSSVYLKIL